MKNKIIFLLGGSGTGKTTTESILIQDPMFSSLVSYTTREKREGEIEGKSYYFRTVEDLKEVEKANLIKISDTWYYTVSKEELLRESNNRIYSVINIKPAADLINYIKDNNIDLEPVIIFFDICRNTRINKMKERGENESDIIIRLDREDKLDDLDKFGLKADYIVKDMTPDMSLKIKEFLCQELQK